MGGAAAVVAPSLYCEPFCLVPVEAQITGTPVITTDFGAFPETVEQGVTGYRCSSMAEFKHAVEDCSGLDRSTIRNRSIQRFATYNIAPKYDYYFNRLNALWSNGFYQEEP